MRSVRVRRAHAVPSDRVDRVGTALNFGAHTETSVRRLCPPYRGCSVSVMMKNQQ